MQRLLRHRLLWPFTALALLLAVNAAFNPGFWQLQWRDGHLYGSVIDILNRAAPLALVALGMTLVIATRGIDISVGAVVAISAAVAALMIGGELVVKDGVQTHVSRYPMSVAIVGALLIQTLTSTIYSIGVPPEVNMVVKAGVVFIVMLLQSPEFRAAIRALVVRPAPGAAP